MAKNFIDRILDAMHEEYDNLPTDGWDLDFMTLKVVVLTLAEICCEQNKGSLDAPPAVPPHDAS